MKKFILKYIDFNKCYTFLLLFGILWITSVALVRVKAIPQKPFQTVVQIIEVYLTLYVYLGFVKFSLIEKKYFFRKLILAAMSLSIIQSVISIIAVLLNNNEIYNLNLVPFAMEYILLFYAFKSVQDVKIHFFKRLSRLYLYLSLFISITAIPILIGQDILKQIPNILVALYVILSVVAAVCIFYVWLLKMRVFRHLSTHMEY